MEISTKFDTHLTKYTVRDFIALAQRACDHGFGTLWLNDNVRYRNIFVVLPAVAAHVPITLGTAVLVQYFHQPVSLADTLAAMSELSTAREFKVGIGIGDIAQTPPYVDMIKPIAMLREMTLFLKQLFSGNTVYFRDFPTLTHYYHLNPDGRHHLAFSPPRPLPFYGGSLGPQSLTTAGRYMDGVIFPAQFLALHRIGRFRAMLQRAEEAAKVTDEKKRFRFAVSVNVSVSHDGTKARRHVLPQVAHSIVSLTKLNLSHDEFEVLGIDPDRLQAIKQRFTEGGTIEEAAELVDERMVNAYSLAGSPDEVWPALTQLAKELRQFGVDELVLIRLGPDYAEALDLLGEQVLPHLRSLS
ncbi:MAG: LLM class flavin-dependent oxidoreductase [Deltaproteobacteria bacterium]|nr:LLM class flavin-dependent oxidoreductase [Deltaproteobacteria bacterium]